MTPPPTPRRATRRRGDAADPRIRRPCRPMHRTDDPAATLRRALRQHAAGVTVITVPGPAGFTATSFTSVSLEPALVSFYSGPCALPPCGPCARPSASPSMCWVRATRRWRDGSRAVASTASPMCPGRRGPADYPSSTPRRSGSPRAPRCCGRSAITCRRRRGGGQWRGGRPDRAGPPPGRLLRGRSAGPRTGSDGAAAHARHRAWSWTLRAAACRTPVGRPLGGAAGLGRGGRAPRPGLPAPVRGGRVRLP